MKQRLTTCLAIGLVLASALACSWFRPKGPISVLTLQIEASPVEREAAVKQAVAVISSRLDALGISNFVVKPAGDLSSGRVLVSFPGVSDPERVKHLITATGRLELVHVISPPSPSPVTTYNSLEAARIAAGDPLPSNRRILSYKRDVDVDAALSENGTNSTSWVVVEAPPLVNGSDLRQARAVKYADNHDYQVNFSLEQSAAERFGAWTAANINEYLGVVLNDEVRSIAFIKSQIFDQGEITGRFTKNSAEDLALVLNSGALPAPVKVVDERVEK